MAAIQFWIIWQPLYIRQYFCILLCNYEIPPSLHPPPQRTLDNALCAIYLQYRHLETTLILII